MYTAGVMPEAENQHHGVDFAAQIAMFYHKVLASSASGFSFGALLSCSNCAVRTYVKQLGVRRCLQNISFCRYGCVRALLYISRASFAFGTNHMTH